MADNFQDNIGFGGSTFSVSGNAISLGTAAGAKSIIFNNSDSAGHLVWQPNANATVSFPAAGGTMAVVGQTQGLYAVGQTTGQSSSSTFDPRTISISGAGNISVGYSANNLVISGAGGGGGVALSAGANSTS